MHCAITAIRGARGLASLVTTKPSQKIYQTVQKI